MKKSKYKYFQVRPNIGKALTWSLIGYLVFEALIDAGEFVGLSTRSGGFSSFISTITQSGVGKALLLVFSTSTLLYIWEWFRRLLNKIGSVLRYVVLALMTLSVCDLLASFVVNFTGDPLHNALQPSGLYQFAASFRSVSSFVQSVLLLALTITLVIKYSGRLATYGWVNIICMLLSGVGTGWLYMLVYNSQASLQSLGISSVFVLLRYVFTIVPVIFLRRTMISNISNDSNI